MADDRILFLDTTLRDGEQSAGIGMTGDEKMEIARQLQKMHVDIIEAGFAASSPGDFEAVSNIAREVKGPIIASLARAVANDVDQAWEAVKHAERPRIHVFLSSSEIHQMHQLRKNREEVMEMAVTMVERAKKLCPDVEFSPMDATRTNREYLYHMLEEVIRAGATTVNIADTVGYAIPSDFAELLRDIQAKVAGIDGVTLSVHCHNDLGLAVANSLAAIKAGAFQVEGCINGIGERAGNASLEEIIMAVDTRKDFFKVDMGIDTTQIYQASRLVSRITGMAVQANKAVVGENAFRHASGIHQDGVLKNRSTYEVMQPERVGVPGSTMVLGKLSGRAGLQSRLEDLGYVLSRAARSAVDHVHFSSGDHDIPTATVRLIGPDGQVTTDASTGNGPVDAVCNAIDRVIGCTCKLVDFNVQSVTEGLDSMGTVTIRIEKDGQKYTGRGASTDIIVASAKAYLSAVNRMLAADEEAKLPPVGTTPD